VNRRSRIAVALAPVLLACLASAARAAETATVTEAPEVSGIVVTAPRDESYRAKRSSTATRTDTPLRDVPQAVTVITDELIRDQSMRSMADVVRYVPGVTMGQGEGHRDAPTLRGNSSTADFFVDGVRDDVQYFRDLYNSERIEVLKGPNAMIFGRGGGGGVINRVTKKADWTSGSEVQAEVGSYDHRRLVADLSQPLTDAVAARVAGVLEDSGSYRDFVEVRRWGINPTLAWRSAERLNVVAGYEHFEDERTVDRGIPSFSARPSPAGTSVFFGAPDQSYATTEVDLVNVGVEHQAAGGLVIRNRTVLGVYDKFYQNVFPGAVTADASGAPATVAISAYNNLTERQNLFNQTDLVWKTSTGPLKHTFLAGVELGRQVTDSVRLTGYVGASTTRTTPFASPTLAGAPFSFRPNATDADNHVVAKIAAVYVQDQVAIGDHLQLIAGLRIDSFDLDFRNNRNGQRLTRRDEMVSPRLGVVVKPSEPVSLYASYSVSYLPSSGDQFSSLTPTTAAFEPEKFVNYEAGLKWDLTPALAFTAAIYELERDNTTAPDPNRPGVIVLTGSQRSRGVEVGLSGQVTDAWEVVGGYGWQEAEITSRTSAAPAGRRVPLTPEHTFSLWNKYRVNETFAVGLGVVRQSKMFAAIDNAVVLPGFTRLDGAVFVRLSPALRAQVNIENLTDERYFPTSHGSNNIMPGAPRSVRASLVAAF
jgi:catecholate siderophore receptor